MIDRRCFLKMVLAGAASSLLPIDPLKAYPPPGNGNATFAVVHGENAARAVRKALELVGGIEKFIAKGDVVFVKPNMSWDRIPTQAANTNPAVVAEVVNLALEAGAKKVVVADNSCNDARRSYTRSGIKEAAEKAGAKVLYMESRKFVKTGIGGEVLKEWPVYKEVLNADKIINIPVAKHHGLSGVTLSMKNMMGLIGGRRNRLHQNLDESIVDLTAFFKPTLHILDAVRVLKANGPQGGSLKDVEVMNTVAASTDPVKIDAFGISLLGKNPEEFRYLRLAAERGLGTMDFKGRGFRETKLS